MSATCDEIQIGRLRLWEEQGGAIELVPDEFCRMLAPATHCLREWADYWAECAGADVLRVGGDRVEVSHGRFRVRFENQLGITQLQPYVGSQLLSEPLCVEVISSKFPTPSQHCAFYQRLLDDLFARAARIPFTASALTARGVTEALRPPSPLFVLHFLCCWGQELRTALAAVQMSPHRQLWERADIVPIWEATEADADVLISIMHNADELERASGFTLATRLGQRAPLHVWQRLPEETFDTPENRFARHFLGTVAAAAEALPAQRWWPNVQPTHRHAIGETATVLRQGLAASPLDEVGEMHHFPGTSQVLLRRDGYRELRQLWQVFHQARRPLFTQWQQAIDVRDVATLYEIWVFFALVEEIAGMTGQSPVLDLRISDEHGLNWNSMASFGDAGELVYNQSWPGYSGTLHPDYTWIPSNGAKVVLDAKFRLERGQMSGTEEGEDDSPPSDRQTGRTGRSPQDAHVPRCLDAQERPGRHRTASGIA